MRPSGRDRGALKTLVLRLDDVSVPRPAERRRRRRSAGNARGPERARCRIVAALRDVGAGHGAARRRAEPRRCGRASTHQGGELDRADVGDGAAAVVVGEGAPIARLLASARSTVDFVDHFRRRSRDLRLPVGRALDSRRRLYEDRSAGDRALPGRARTSRRRTSRISACRPWCRASSTAVAKAAGHCRGGDRRQPAHRLRRHRRGASAAAAGRGAENVRSRASAFSSSASARAPMRCCSSATGEHARCAGTARLRGHLARRREETNYAKFLAFNELIEIERGMRSETDKLTPLSALWRNRDTVTGMIGGKCERLRHHPVSDVAHLRQSELQRGRQRRSRIRSPRRPAA